MQTMSTTVKTSLTKLINLALYGLEPLYDNRQKLFTHRVKQGRLTTEVLHSAITYTAITILGLAKARQHNWDNIPVDEIEALQSLVENIGKVARPGDLGLILWADAHCKGQHHKTILQAIKPEVTIEKLRHLPTMELAWLLIGLSYTYQYSAPDKGVEKMALILYAAMINNFDSWTGLFSHRQAGQWPASVRDQIGNFADQIYSVYAFSLFHEVFGQSNALQMALQCAHRLCALQGDQGQWWWHYHAQQDIVASSYPVYAVHQDGMAPMALFKLSSVSGQDFTPAIQRGLSWLTKNNELGAEIIDWDRNIVWRDIEWARPRVNLRYISMTTAGLGWGKTTRWLNSITSYKLNYEMRSYHLGWLLYAFADQRTLDLHL